MPYQLDFDEAGHGVVVSVTGLLEGSQCLEATRAIYDRPDPLRYQIWDLSQCQGMSLEPSELHAILLADKAEERRNPDHRAAIILGRSPVGAMAQAYRTFGKWVGLRMNIRAFSDLESAQAWVREAADSAAS